MPHLIFVPVPNAEKYPNRPLTIGEKQMVKSVFGAEKFKYDEIVILNRPHWRLIHIIKKRKFLSVAHVVGTKMFMSNKSQTKYEKDYSLVGVSLADKCTFMHEMTHIWQHQLGKGRYNALTQKQMNNILHEKDPLLEKYSLNEITEEEVLESRRKYDSISNLGKIPHNPPISAVIASRHHAKEKGITQEEMCDFWDKNAEYDYLRPSAVDLNFYELNVEQQANLIGNYYYIKHCPKEDYNPNAKNSITWRKLKPIEYYEKMIPFLPK
ncbi:hypothetical protein [Parasulfitobacter algicola]|uniref:Uncharacterized protein n=1 Tax=Parasulfitobacter algicola TaxID=2614809 RepID=A0ABX2IRH3_9RHOB|nr:hypothetical protein [Sulfitobacter algicola]NSX55497.1 hypothetical protein [Sulfitobacter algicola]